jgi:hypothetical protein
MFSVVGYCPICGCPIYCVSVWNAITPPPSILTCNCLNRKESNVKISYIHTKVGYNRDSIDDTTENN